jgi:hypothetical protein
VMARNGMDAGAARLHLQAHGGSLRDSLG